MGILTRNKLLRGAETAIEAQLLPETRAAYDKIVVAGMKTALHGPNPTLAGLRDSKDVVKDAAAGAVSLVLLLAQKANGQMPVNAMIPAASALMIQALDFAEKAKLLTVEPQDLGRAITLQGNIWLALGKITPAKLEAMAEKTHGLMQDPTAMEQINRTAGVVKDARASSPTDLPLAKGMINQPREARNGV